MEIKRGKYTLKSDRWCFWIEEEYINKKGKKDIRNVSGYYADIEQLANGLANHTLGESEATSMRKLIDDVRSIKQKVAEMTAEKVREIKE